MRENEKAIKPEEEIEQPEIEDLEDLQEEDLQTKYVKGGATRKTDDAS